MNEAMQRYNRSIQKLELKAKKRIIWLEESVLLKVHKRETSDDFDFYFFTFFAFNMFVRIVQIHFIKKGRLAERESRRKGNQQGYGCYML